VPLLSDEITLNDVKFPISGFGRAAAASEFETGIKVGPAAYDNREHAFFHVFNDFSGGMGYRHLNVRDEQGTFWDAANLDTRRPSHITLAPNVDTVTPASGPALPPDLEHLPSRPFCRMDSGQWLMGMGSGIYRSTLDLTDWVITDNASSGTTLQVSSIIRTPYAGTAPGDASYLATYAGRGSTQRYRISHNGSAWTNGAQDKALLDSIWWDNKIIAVEGITIIYGIVDSSGAESWNTDDVDDGLPIVTVPSARYESTSSVSRLRIVGIGPSPADGTNVVYFTDGREIFYLDFYLRRYHKIEIDIPVQALHGATIWQGDIIFTDGWEVWSYGGSNGTLRPIGLPKRSGTPPHLSATYGQLSTSRMVILGLIPAAEFLYAVGVSGLEGGTMITHVLCYNQVGWHSLGTATTLYGGFYGFVAAPSSIVDTSPRKLVIPTIGLLDESNTDVKVSLFHIPSTGQTPQVGVDEFVSTGIITTGWLDGGFNDMDGTLLRLNIDAFNLSSDEYVTVAYQLDNDESTTWTKMVDAAGNQADFDGTTTELYFTGGGPGLGLEFRKVRFYFSLNRGSDATQSPEVRAITLTFLKTPPLRTQWTVTVDLNRMLESAEYLNGTERWTLETLWSHMTDLWTNSNRLIVMSIPSMVPDYLNVKVNAMEVTFDDFRHEIEGRGALTLTLLEPIISTGSPTGTNINSTVTF
jgi:hypothetical protein